MSAGSRELNVAAIIAGDEGYGIRRFLVTQAAGAREAGLRMSYLCLQEGPLVDELRPHAAEIIFLDCARWRLTPENLSRDYLRWTLSRRGSWAMAKAVHRALAPRRIDALYSQSHASHLVAGLAKRRLRLPAVGHFHGVLSRTRALGLSRHALSWLFWGLLDRIVTITDFARDTFAWPATEHVRRVYNGVNVEEVAAAGRGAVKEPGLIVVVGRLVANKRVDIAIQALAELKRRGVACRLEIIGGTDPAANREYPALKALVEKLGLCERVSFAGDLFPPYARVAQADAFVHCSAVEAFGLVVIEALACGTLAVVPDQGGTTELVEAGRTGLHYRALDAAALADALQRILEDRALRERLASEARAQAGPRFGVAAHIAGMRAVFDECVREAPR